MEPVHSLYVIIAQNTQNSKDFFPKFIYFFKVYQILFFSLFFEHRKKLPNHSTALVFHNILLRKLIDNTNRFVNRRIFVIGYLNSRLRITCMNNLSTTNVNCYMSKAMIEQQITRL